MHTVTCSLAIYMLFVTTDSLIFAVAGKTEGESQSADCIGQSVSQTGFWRGPDAAFQQARTGCTPSATRAVCTGFVLATISEIPQVCDYTSN